MELDFRYTGQPLAFAWLRDEPDGRTTLEIVDERQAMTLLVEVAAVESASFLREVLRRSIHNDDEGLSDARVIDELARALVERRLLILRDRERLPGGGPPQRKSEPPGPLPPGTKTDFIEIVLEDRHGRRVPFERYGITLPNGEVRTGSLDKDGFARVDGIRPGGVCDVTFPEIHGPEWRKKS